jgi:Holliday junction resolvase
MRIPSDILYNPNGDLRVRLRPVSDQARWRVNRKNTANGIAFARQIVASFQQNGIKAWRHPIGRRYPVTVSVDLGGVRLGLLTKFWTRTDNRSDAFYLTREFYESRRRGVWPDQVQAVTAFSRNKGAVPFLVPSLELPTGRHAIFVPFNVVETLMKYEIKIGLGVFDGWPAYPLLPDGRYDIDVDEVAELVRNLQAGDQDADQ